MLPIDATLEFVECDHRFKLFRPSLPLCSKGSTATLFLRLWSCDIGSRPSRRAMSDVSPGLCDLIGTVEFLAPVLVELSEPVRLTVTTDDEDREFDREEYRCLGKAEAEGTVLPPLLAAETEEAVPCIIVFRTPTDNGQPYTRALCANSTSSPSSCANTYPAETFGVNTGGSDVRMLLLLRRLRLSDTTEGCVPDRRCRTTAEAVCGVPSPAVPQAVKRDLKGFAWYFRATLPRKVSSLPHLLGRHGLDDAAILSEACFFPQRPAVTPVAARYPTLDRTFVAAVSQQDGVSQEGRGTVKPSTAFVWQMGQSLIVSGAIPRRACPLPSQEFKTRPRFQMFAQAAADWATKPRRPQTSPAFNAL